MKNIKNSKNVFKQALKYMPGGVNSPVRSFSAVKEDPRFIKRSFGAYIEDIDNNIYRLYIFFWATNFWSWEKRDHRCCKKCS